MLLVYDWIIFIKYKRKSYVVYFVKYFAFLDATCVDVRGKRTAGSIRSRRALSCCGFDPCLAYNRLVNYCLLADASEDIASHVHPPASEPRLLSPTAGEIFLEWPAPTRCSDWWLITGAWPGRNNDQLAMLSLARQQAGSSHIWQPPGLLRALRFSRLVHIYSVPLPLPLSSMVWRLRRRRGVDPS